MGGRNKLKIVALGDSITQGFPFSDSCSWVAIVAGKYDVSIINHGICGDYTSGMLARFHSDVISEKPDLVIILGAYNDAFSDIPLETVSANFEKMCSLAFKHNIEPVLGLPTPVDIPSVESVLCEYRNWIKAYALKENIKVINFFKMFFNPDTGGTMPGMTTDGAHPSIEGYKKMAEAIKPDILSNGL